MVTSLDVSPVVIQQHALFAQMDIICLLEPAQFVLLNVPHAVDLLAIV